MYRRTHKQPWLLALMATLVAALMSWQAWSIVPARELRLDRFDVVAAFGPDACQQNNSCAPPVDEDADGLFGSIGNTFGLSLQDILNSGLAFVSVEQDGQDDSNVTLVDSGSVALGVADMDCRAGNRKSCRYAINGLRITAGEFELFGRTVSSLTIVLAERIPDVIDSGAGLAFGSSARFRASAMIDGERHKLEVGPTDGEGSLRLFVNLDDQSVTLAGAVTGQTPDGKLKLDLVFSSTNTADFTNVPPNADAGQDKEETTSCFADVNLVPQSSDPNGDLAAEAYSAFGQLLGIGETTVRLLPGEWSADLLARDKLGAEDTDSVAVRVEDDGEFDGALPEGATLVRFLLPRGIAADEVALLAAEKLQVSSRAKVTGQDGALANVVNLGPVSSNVESYFYADSTTNGHVWSQPRAWLLERAKISGTLFTTSQPERQSDTFTKEVVLGEIATHAFSFVIGPRLDQWDVGHVEPTESRPLAPGDYGFAAIKGTLRVEPGVYRFSQLQTEPGSSIEISGDEPVVVVVDGTTTLRGQVTGGQLFLISLDQNEVTVTSPYEGAVLAPNARLTLNSANMTKHRGAFFGKSIQVDSDAIVEHSVAAFDAFAATRSACALRPRVECIESTPNGYVAHFTYENLVPLLGIRVPQGLANRLGPNGTAQTQPTVFRPGRLSPHRFEVPFSSSVSWTLGANTARATQSSSPCQ